MFELSAVDTFRPQTLLQDLILSEGRFRSLRANPLHGLRVLRFHDQLLTMLRPQIILQKVYEALELPFWPARLLWSF